MSKPTDLLIPLLFLICFALINNPVLARPLADLNIRQLWLDRQGNSEQAFMRTNHLVSYMIPDTSYQIFIDKVTPTQYTVLPKRIKKAQPPPHLMFEGLWIDSEHSYHTASVLGGIGSLITRCKKLKVPAVQATPESLSYFQARLVKEGDIITIHSPGPLIMTDLTVGKAYVHDYIMVEDLGGGAYLEYHDTPHFHMPASPESGGYLLLGEKHSDKLLLTAFKIPFGYGVYTPPNVVHSDAYLTGRYMVMYTFTEQFSTVHLKDAKGEMTELMIVPEQQALDRACHNTGSDFN